MPKTKNKNTVTPLMQQYNRIKSKYPDALLLFRVGDFYETFGKDAIVAANILGIVLTARNNGGSKIELAGFPHHSLQNYLPKLVKGGIRVAVCDQLEEATKGKKIVKRGVTELVTPGVVLNDQILDNKGNNFLAAVPVKLPFHISETFLAKTSVSIDLPLYFFKNSISSSTRTCCSALLGIRPPGS